MDEFTLVHLAEPVKLKQGRGRPVELHTAVFEGKKVFALFKNESAARAYCTRLNGLRWL